MLWLGFFENEKNYGKLKIFKTEKTTKICASGANFCCFSVLKSFPRERFFIFYFLKFSFFSRHVTDGENDEPKSEEDEEEELRICPDCDGNRIQGGESNFSIFFEKNTFKNSKRVRGVFFIINLFFNFNFLSYNLIT